MTQPEDFNAEIFSCDERGFRHIPVLYREVLEYLNVKNGPQRFVDGTLGCGGHSSLILKANEQAEVLGIDCDDEALSRAKKNLSFAPDRIHLHRGKFGDLHTAVADFGWRGTVDAVLLDLGISSPQIDDAERGFSLRRNGPLDMRMDRRTPNTACRILNHADVDELKRIFKNYGEIRQSGKLARAIVREREQQPWINTLALTELCEKVLGRPRPGGPPPATQCFQALRIAVNDELGELERVLEHIIELLKPDGRIVIISFHSLEDRIVKKFFRREASECLCPPGLPVCRCGHHRTLEILTKKPITAKADETAANPRAKCAKLRAARKL